METRSQNAKVRVINKTIEGSPFVLDSFVSDFTTAKDIDTPAGSFSITLVPRTSPDNPISKVHTIPFWLKTIKKNDLISIGIDKEGSIMFGRIDAISRTTSNSPTGYAKAVRIVGRDWTSLLLDDDIVYAPELALSKKAVEVLGEQRATFLGILRGFTEGENGNIFYNRKVLEAIVWVMLNMPSIHLNVIYADYNTEGVPSGFKTDKIGKLFEFQLQQYVPDTLFDPNLTQYSGKVWNYIMQCIDPLFYEAYFDSVILNDSYKPTIIIRPKPWSKSTEPNMEILTTDLRGFDFTQQTKGVSVPTLARFETEYSFWDERGADYVIEGKDVYDEDDITHTADIINFVTMHPTRDVLANTPLARYGYLYPLMDTYSVKKWGIRKFTGNTNLFQKEDGKEITVEDQRAKDLELKEGLNYILYGISINYQKRRDILYYWNRLNEHYLSGHKTVRGNEHYRLGMKYFFPDTTDFEGRHGVEYYCKSIQHNYKKHATTVSFLSTLGLIRGINKESELEYVAAIQEEDSLIRIDGSAIDSGKIQSSGKSNSESEDEVQSFKRNDVQSLSDGSIDGDGSYPISKAAKDEFLSAYSKHQALYFRFELDDKKVPEKKIPVSSSEVLEHVSYTGRKYGINPNILMALFKRESAWVPSGPRSISSAKAVGLGQHMGGNDRHGMFGSSHMAGWKKQPLNNDIRYDCLRNIEATGIHLTKDKGWGKSKRSKIVALNRYWGEKANPESSKAYYMNYLKPAITKYLPKTELYS